MFDRYFLIITVFIGVYALVAWMLPFSFFVDIKSQVYSDMCVGDRHQDIIIDRDTWFNRYVEGVTKGQLFFYDGVHKHELIIFREGKIDYQPEEGPKTVQIEWDKPVERAGTYGASEKPTITPLPLFKTGTYIHEDNHLFEVKDCGRIGG